MSQEQIDYIMDTFDFHRVQRTMELLQWKWQGASNGEVPTVFELRQKARWLLNNVPRHEDLLASGGFEAECSYGTLSLKFVLEDAYGVD